MHTEDKDKMETNITTFHRHKIPTTQRSSNELKERSFFQNLHRLESLFLTRLSWSQVFDDERYISANVGIEQVVKYEYVGIL